MNNKFIYSHSLGCKVNSYETFSIVDLFVLDGYKITTDFSKANIIILNTCSVTGRADQKSRQFISRFRRNNKEAILVVMGCSMQSYGETAISLGADIVVGTVNRNLIFSLVKKFELNHEKINLVSKTIMPATYEEFGSHAFSENIRAYLKIQDGCDNFCSYCLIPLIRGNSRSRLREECLKEAKILVEKGYEEIVISGIHIGNYGTDLYGQNYRLASLLRDIISQNPTLKRIRISSIEETEIDDDFISLLKESTVVVDHLHIPLQSGSSTVLQRMHRKYDTNAFLNKLDRIRTVRPLISITTDVIAGFPMETDQEWEETVSFCKKANFSEIHVFPFSSRPNTLASTLPQVKDIVKTNRVNELLKLSNELQKNYISKFIDKEQEVLFEEYSKKENKYIGHTSNYIPVSIESSKNLIGTFKKIILKETMISK